MQDDNIERLNINGYKLINYSSRSSSRGGGTAIFAREEIDIIPVNSKILCVEGVCEFCAAEVRIGSNVSVIIICLYRPPSYSLDDSLSVLDILLDDLYRPNKYLVVAGDFNVDFATSNIKEATVLNLMTGYGLVAHGIGMTRRGYNSDSQLDNICSNIPIQKLEFRNWATDISDHYGQVLYVETNEAKKSNHFSLKRSFSGVQIEHFKNLVKQETWEEVFDIGDTEGKYSNFINILYYYFDLSFPKCKGRVKQTSSWVTTEIKQYAQYIKDLYVSFKNTNCPQILAFYKSERKKYRKFLSDHKKNINHNKIASSNNVSKTLWHIFNTETQRKSNMQNITLKSEKGDLIEDPKQIADNFVSRFMLPPTGHSTVLNSKKALNYPTLFLYPTDKHEIFRYIMKLPNKYSTGLDEIPIFIIKVIGESVCEPLAHIINNMFQSGVFPEKLKRAKVIPVFKKGSRYDSANYRPISLLPSVSKIFERAIYERLLVFLNQNYILVDQQFGFRPNRSTELAIFNSISYIYEKLDNNEKVAGLYFDLSRAFDTINHNILLTKLET